MDLWPWRPWGSTVELLAYTASKQAAVGMSKVLAREVAPYGIRVNCLPGATDTEAARTTAGAEALLEATAASMALG